MRWKFVYTRGNGRTWVRDGGCQLGPPPCVWVLTDYKPGHTTQSLGLAEALGWPQQVKALRFTVLNAVSNRLLGATRATVRRRGSAELVPPWPDVVIAAGRRTVPVARWIGEQSGGRTRLVQLGRLGGNVAHWFDAVVSCAYFQLPPDPRRVETIAPPNPIRPVRAAGTARSLGDPFAGALAPRVALLVGGGTIRHRLNRTVARRMGEEVEAFVAKAGGTLFAVTSRRTSKASARALRLALGTASRLYIWRREDPHNPYRALLSSADAIVVTGESESMLAEAAASGKPVYIYPLPARPRGPATYFRQWVTDVASSRPLNSKGTVRPQQGCEYLCARLIQVGLVRPPVKIEELHRSLFRLGIAFPFGSPLGAVPRQPLCEMESVAERVAALLGCTWPATPAPQARAVGQDGAA